MTKLRKLYYYLSFKKYDFGYMPRNNTNIATECKDRSIGNLCNGLAHLHKRHQTTSINIQSDKS